MKCLHYKSIKPAPLWHRITCRECRKSVRADAMIRLAMECVKASDPPEHGLSRTLSSVGLSPFNTWERARRIAKIVKRVGIVVVSLLAISTISVLGWMSYSNSDPVFPRRPMQAMPSPNGYDEWQVARRALVDDDKTVNQTFNEMDDALAKGKPADIKALASLANKNHDAVEALREAVKHEYRQPFASLQTDYLKGVETLADLLVMSGECAAERGDWHDALGCWLDCCEFGVKIPVGASIFGLFRGNRIECNGLLAIARSLGKVPESELRPTADRLLAIEAKRQPLSATELTTYYASLDELAKLFHTPNWRHALFAGTGVQSLSLHDRLSLYILTKQRFVDNYTHIVHHELEFIDKPYDKCIFSIENPRNDFVSLLLSPACTNYKAHQCALTASTRLLAVQLLLREYKMQHGSYPKRLGDLPSIRNAETPIDPFSPGLPFHYQSQEGKYSLYSIGPDQLDDGGKPIMRNDMMSSHYIAKIYQIGNGSTGDIVAGTNL